MKLSRHLFVYCFCGARLSKLFCSLVFVHILPTIFRIHPQGEKALPNSQTHHHKPQQEPNKPTNTTGIERQKQHYTYTMHYLFSSCFFCFSLLFSCFCRLFFLLFSSTFVCSILSCNSRVLSLVFSVCSHVCLFYLFFHLYVYFLFCSFICSFPCSFLFVFLFFHTFSYRGISDPCAFSLPFTPLA